MPAPEEELNLSTLKPAQKRKARKRVGRGMGSGKGRYSGRGIKGQKSRSGSHTMRPGFEGGQMPIYMRLGKKRGPYSKDAMPVGPHRTHTVAVNVRDLERVFDDGADVSLEALVEKGLIKNTRIDVKILGEGELKKKLTVTAHLFSKTAREKIESAGGTATALREPVEKKRKTRKAKPVADEAEPETETEEAAEAQEAPADEARSFVRGIGECRFGGIDVLLADERLAGPGAPPPRALHGHDPRLLPAGELDPGAGRQLGRHRLVLLRPGRHDPRPPEHLLGRRARAVRPLRARDHALRHGLDHPPAHDRGDPAARAAAEGG